MSVLLRSARESDDAAVAAAVDTWWTLPGHDTPAARRERAALLPRLWLQHFAGTSLVAERGGALGLAIEGAGAKPDYDGPGVDRVAYVRALGDAGAASLVV